VTKTAFKPVCEAQHIADHWPGPLS